MKFGYIIEPPFNFIGEDGAVTGHDVALARHVAEALGEPFEPVETEFAELLPGLAYGRWRMTTGMFATAARREFARFSRPIWAMRDGLLVAKGNPHAITGYRSVAVSAGPLAVLRSQVQYDAGLALGVPAAQICVFETYLEAATAVRDGRAVAYASVARAHAGFMERHADWALDIVPVPAKERPPAFGAFAVARTDADLCAAVDACLLRYVGSPDHRQMAARFGLSDDEIDAVSSR